MKFRFIRIIEIVGAYILQSLLVSLFPSFAVFDIPCVVLAIHYLLGPTIAAQSLLIYSLLLLMMGVIPVYGPLVFIGSFIVLHVVITNVFTTKTSLSLALEGLLIAVVYAVIRYGFATGGLFFAPPNIVIFILVQAVAIFVVREIINATSDQLRQVL